MENILKFALNLNGNFIIVSHLLQHCKPRPRWSGHPCRRGLCCQTSSSRGRFLPVRQRTQLWVFLYKMNFWFFHTAMNIFSQIFGVFRWGYIYRCANILSQSLFFSPNPGNLQKFAPVTFTRCFFSFSFWDFSPLTPFSSLSAASRRSLIPANN